jgi:hypothetical protein
LEITGFEDSGVKPKGKAPNCWEDVELESLDPRILESYAILIFNAFPPGSRIGFSFLESPVSSLGLSPGSRI